MSNAINTFLQRLGDHKKKRKIAVVGDPMIDHYFHVKADRVSPEFPIPVMESLFEYPCERMPGGAANVCLQLQNFPCESHLFGILDSDASSLYSRCGIFHCVPHNCITPVKNRFYHNEFPLCRWDIERPNYGYNPTVLKDAQQDIYTMFDSQTFDVVIFSDYGKGMFSEAGIGAVPWATRDLNPIMILDPKDGPLSRWRGVSVVKPNAQEAERLTGSSDWRKQCEIIMEETDCTAVVITQGGEGVVGVVMGREFEYRPSNAVHASSVVGAGDCFVGILGLCMSLQMDIIAAAEVAFEAGAIYVQNRLNTPIKPQDLSSENYVFRNRNKRVLAEELVKREPNTKLVLTNGCFDVIHPGHISLLRQAKEFGTHLVVAVNSDLSVKKLKGEARPICSLEDRCSVLEALEMVDYVVVFHEETPREIIATIQPDVLVKGSEYSLDEIVGADVVPEVHTIPMVDGCSTTNLISKIKSQK